MARQDPVFAPSGAHTVNSTLSTVQTLTPPAGTEVVMMQATVQNVRYTLDGSNPSATVGFQLKAGDMIVLPILPGRVIKAIQEVASATLQYQWGVLSWT